MDVFVKVTAGALICVVLYIMLGREARELSILLTVAVCVMVALSALQYMEPVLAFFSTLQSTGDLDSDLLTILLKAVGISIIAEITARICADGGNDALGKTLQMTSSIAVLWLSIPLFTKLLKLIDDILSAI